MTTQPETYIVADGINAPRPLAVFIGICEHCPRPVRASSDTFMDDHYPSTCIDCHKPLVLQRLYGTVTKMDCHPACMSAYGRLCDCGCGGVNHGDIWSRPGEMLADALKVFLADRARRAAAVQKRQDAKAAREQAAFNAWAAEHTELIAELTATDWLNNPYPNNFLTDMAHSVVHGQPLTDPQTERTTQILAWRREVRERIAAEQAERAARAASLTDVPTGRQVITGKIIAAWTFEGDWGTVYKIKVDCGTFQVRGTLPRNLEIEALPRGGYSGEDYQNLRHTLKGRTVTLTAALRPDGQETGQGYFSRPAKASFIEN